VLLLVFAAVLLIVQAALAGTGGGPLTATGAAAPMSPASAQVWIVRPGDTLWAIARALDPRADPRPLVDRLDREIGGGSLYPGERIAIPDK